MSVISVDNLSLRRRQSLVLEDISFQVAAGEYVGIVGPNGSGKSSLVKAILGLLPLAAGRVEIMGQDLASFSQWQQLGYLPQAATVSNKRFPATVSEVVATGLLGSKSFPRRLGRGDRELVAEALELLGIGGLSNEMVGSLSGGQCQRVFLARAMVARPAILILDEPTAALDPATRDNFYELLARLNGEQQTTIMLVTHDSATIGRYAGKMLYVDRRLIFYGSFSDFCQSQAMAAYFGDFAQHLICHQH
ncbi:MAG: metal ABC transporter ATP-binding protein [Thermodesulfobacteriota bacterium]